MQKFACLTFLHKILKYFTEIITIQNSNIICDCLILVFAEEDDVNRIVRTAACQCLHYIPLLKFALYYLFSECSGKHIIWGIFGRENYVEFIGSISAECILQKLPCGPQHSNSEHSKICHCTS